MHEAPRAELLMHMLNAAHALLIGRTLAHKYAIEHLIATGGMGAVYRARQIALDKSVAVKVLHRELAGEPKFVARFKREALSASRLEHPNSLRVIDFGEDQGLLYLVMEYVDAEELLKVMNREWPLDNERIVAILTQVLAALAVAHELGVVHRDLKPENILVVRSEDDDGMPVEVVKVCDFGVAKIAPRGPSDSFGPHLTLDGLAIGTPDYMSPEQARGESVDGRSDLYSVGVVLYHMLTGRTPFGGDSPLAVALRQVSDPPLPPSRHRYVHPVLEAICLRALSKQPEDRFQTAREMRRALQNAIDEMPRSSSSVPPLVLTPPSVTTARFGSSSPVELSSPQVRAFLVARRRARSRLRQAAGASAVGALLALGIATSLPAVRRTIEQQFHGRFELVQTVAAALMESVPRASPRTVHPSMVEVPLIVIEASPTDDGPTCTVEAAREVAASTDPICSAPRGLCESVRSDGPAHLSTQPSF
jgi:eukaryotic-like serine/threonine-protein kinase